MKPLLINQKVKLQLVQPNLICSGRDRVTAYYRGKVLMVGENMAGKPVYYLIKFKYRGEEIIKPYWINEGFRETILADIQLIE